MRIYALLDRDTALGFKLAGVEVYEVKNRKDIKNLFPSSLLLKDVGILLISEELAEVVREEINIHLYSGKFPIVVEIRSFRGKERKRKNIDELIKDSIGISV